MWSDIRPPLRLLLSLRAAPRQRRSRRMSRPRRLGAGALASPCRRRVGRSRTRARTPGLAPEPPPLAVARQRIEHADPAMPHQAPNLVLAQLGQPIGVGHPTAQEFLHGVDRQEDLPDAE